MESVAILWDIENVTPSANSQFVEGLLEFTHELGRITVCRVYGDWTKRNLARLSHLLSENGFELIHIPASRKNSADISLITNAVELIYQYPHLTKIVLITGDADFRPLLHTLRRNGKSIHIICNSSNASEELLSLADSFKDYREIIPGEAAEAAEEAQAAEQAKRTRRTKGRAPANRSAKAGPPSAPEKTPSEDTAYRLLVEAVQEMEKNKKKPGMGAVKVKLKILNPSFDERSYGFKSWVDFVNSACDKKFIRLVEDEQATYLASYGPEDPTVTQETPLAAAFETLRSIVDELTKEKGKDYHSLASINTRLNDSRVDYGALGYKRLKDFIFSAEKRAYVDMKYENAGYYVKKKN
jgi:uncharacterized protein (TIGR00288 family)